MRWKEGGINYASGSFSIPGSSVRVCAYDNGTQVCDKGHKITTPGQCYSQSIGTIISTDPTFQPTYPICLVDYMGLINSSGFIFNRQYGISSTFNISTLDVVLSAYSLVLSSLYTEKEEYLVVKSIYKLFDSLGIRVWSDSITDSYSAYLSDYYMVGTFKLLLLNSGYILRAINAFSELYQYDVYGSVSLLMPYYFFPKITRQVNLVVIDDITGSFSEVESLFKLSVENSSGGENENPTDICVGDLTKPSLENILPIPGSVLRPNTSSISFTIIDAIGGVDRSSLYITISGSITAQAGGSSIIEAGVIQTPLYAFLDGDENSYEFTYNPPFLWADNETVSIAAHGSDKLPLDAEDEEFICGGLSTNSFDEAWSFNVAGIKELTCSIVGLADSEPPYIDSIYPVPFYAYARYDDDITFNIKDDHAGVDLSTLYVYINNIPVISAGVINSGNVFLAGEKNSYQFTWSNTVGFIYGDRVEVHIVVSDLYAVLPNMLDTTYYFDVVDDSSLQFLNFLPAVGITPDLENVNIEIDIIDSLYNIDQNNLYISMNQEVVDSTKTNIQGNRNLTTTYSGLTAISGTWIHDAEVLGSIITNTTVSGSYIIGGSIEYGSSISGFMGSFPAPFDLTPSGMIISADLYEGIVVSGTLETVLVSGTNWDGKYENSTITDVSLSGFYCSSVSSYNTIISGTIGYHLEYHPVNDFAYDRPIDILIHAENLNSISPVVRERIYRLFYGYNVKTFNTKFNNNDRIVVYLEALNTSNFSAALKNSYYFNTKEKSISNIYASINIVEPWLNITADIQPQAPVHRYGETITVVLYAQDVQGNVLGPYTFSYTIEDAPE